MEERAAPENSPLLPPLFAGIGSGGEGGEESPTLESRHGVVVEEPPPESPVTGRQPRRRKPKSEGSSAPPPPLSRDWNPPPEWKKKTRVRATGASAGSTDSFYYHPVTGRQYRSKREVFNFLNGIEPKRHRGKPDNKKTKDDNRPFEGSELKNKETEAHKMTFESSSSKKRRGRETVMNCSFKNPPMNSSTGSWTPFIGHEMVPESVKRVWATAFTSLSGKNGGKISQES